MCVKGRTEKQLEPFGVNGALRLMLGAGLGLGSGVANMQGRVTHDGTRNKEIILTPEITRVRAASL